LCVPSTATHNTLADAPSSTYPPLGSAGSYMDTTLSDGAERAGPRPTRW